MCKTIQIQMKRAMWHDKTLSCLTREGLMFVLTDKTSVFE